LSSPVYCTISYGFVCPFLSLAVCYYITLRSFEQILVLIILLGCYFASLWHETACGVLQIWGVSICQSNCITIQPQIAFSRLLPSIFLRWALTVLPC